MKVLLFSNHHGKEQIEVLLRKQGVTLVTENPEVVVCFGGDGTVLLAEHRYPGVPKLALGHSTKSVPLSPSEAIARLVQGTFAIQEEEKLRGALNGKILPTAMNDFVLRNVEQQHAIRFNVEIDRQPVNGEFIGDGLVIATPFGSTAYFHSITRQTFSSGIGVAFNNTVQLQPPLHGQQVRVTLVRGHARLTVDTLDDVWDLAPGDVLEVTLAEDRARLVKFP